MDVKEAVTKAKAHLEELVGDEGLFNVGLEEVEYDTDENTGDGLWLVTLGFSRPWNSTKSAYSVITGEEVAKRAYRTLAINDSDGTVISVKRKDFVS